MLMIKGSLFLLSCFGYWEFLRKRAGVNVFFAPVLTMAIQTCILFFGGLLYILPEAALTLYLLGLVLFACAVWYERTDLVKPYCNFGFGYLALSLLAVLVMVKDSVFYYGDDFSHWAMVVKQILSADRIPNFKDTLINFQHYPLGTALYVYYFCKMAGNTEGLQMFAQASIMIAALLPLYAFAKKQGILTAFIVVLTAMFLQYNIGLYSMMVDSVLPLVGTAAILYVIWLFDAAPAHIRESRTAIWLVAPLAAWASQIKNSGMLFAALAGVAMVLYLVKDRGRILQKIAACIVPLGFFFLWDRHCTNSFLWAAQTKHAMTAMNYIRTFSAKSAEHISSIVFSASRYAFTREGLLWIVLWLAVLGGITFAWAKHRKKLYGGLALCVSVAYVVYTGGVIAMYLFSMPIEEALVLGCIERYLRTIDIAVYVLLSAYAVVLVSDMRKMSAANCIAIVLTLLCVVTGLSMGKIDEDIIYQPEDRNQFEAIVQEYDIPKGTVCYVCTPYDDGGYMYFLSGYLLDVFSDVQWVKDAEQLEAAQNCDMIINLDKENPVIQQWLEEHYPQQAQETVIPVS